MSDILETIILVELSFHIYNVVLLFSMHLFFEDNYVSGVIIS